MPEHTYICHCGEKFNLTTGLPIKDLCCPKCRSNKIRRVFKAPWLNFRGKGFYKTDNPKEKK